MSIPPSGETPEAIFHKLCQDFHFGFVVTTHEPEDPRIVYANPAFTTLTGYPGAEVLGESPRILQGARTERPVLDRLKDCLRKDVPFLGRTWNYRKDGSEFLLEWTIFPTRIGRKRFFCALQRAFPERANDLGWEVDSLSSDFNVALRHNLQLVHGLCVVLASGRDLDPELYQDHLRFQLQSVEALNNLYAAIVTRLCAKQGKK